MIFIYERMCRSFSKKLRITRNDHLIALLSYRINYLNINREFSKFYGKQYSFYFNVQNIIMISLLLMIRVQLLPVLWNELLIALQLHQTTPISLVTIFRSLLGMYL